MVAAQQLTNTDTTFSFVACADSAGSIHGTSRSLAQMICDRTMNPERWRTLSSLSLWSFHRRAPKQIL